MKELKTYISEGFFTNVGANNRIKLAIDTIKDASMNNKINSYERKLEFVDSLAPILRNIEADIKKGKLIFKYTRNDKTCHKEAMVIFEKTKLDTSEWIYYSLLSNAKFRCDTDNLALHIASDLYYETKYPKDPWLQHSIANTIKVTEFKLS